jgi:short-subunit dehydrogenase
MDVTNWLPAPKRDGTALITGGSSGIGEAIARDLAALHHNVTLVARRPDRLEAITREIAQTYGVRAEPLACDVSDPESRDALALKVKRLGQQVDVLVNNAGIGSYGDFVNLDPAHEIQQVRTMCEAVVGLCAAFVPGMATRRSGAVLIISSTTGFQPAARYATYGAAKAFSLSFGQSLHAELRRFGVAVTTVCPGPVSTPFFATNNVQPVRLPKAMWTTPEAVSRAAINASRRNRRVVIPGGPMRALMAASRLSPPALQLRVMDLLLPSATAKSEQLDT